MLFTVAALVAGILCHLHSKTTYHQTASSTSGTTIPVLPAASNVNQTDEPAPIQQEDMDENQTSEPDFTQKEIEDIYLRAQVFRDEALEVFPVYSVETHRPKGLYPGYVDENGIRMYKSFGPPSKVVWIRIRPKNALEMKEIMPRPLFTDDHNIQ